MADDIFDEGEIIAELDPAEDMDWEAIAAEAAEREKQKYNVPNYGAGVETGRTVGDATPAECPLQGPEIDPRSRQAEVKAERDAIEGDVAAAIVDLRFRVGMLEENAGVALRDLQRRVSRLEEAHNQVAFEIRQVLGHLGRPREERQRPRFFPWLTAQRERAIRFVVRLTSEWQDVYEAARRLADTEPCADCRGGNIEAGSLGSYQCSTCWGTGLVCNRCYGADPRCSSCFEVRY